MGTSNPLLGRESMNQNLVMIMKWDDGTGRIALEVHNLQTLQIEDL